MSIDVDQLGQLAVAIVVLAGLVVQQWQARSRAAALSHTAEGIATKVATAKQESDNKLTEIHLLVNSRMTEALERVELLEAKLGLAAGADIPASQILTEAKTIDPDGEHTLPSDP